MNFEIKDKLYKSIKDYCDVNSIDMSSYVNDLLQKGFMLDKYGNKPNIHEPITVQKEGTINNDDKKVKPVRKTKKKETISVVNEVKKDDTVIVNDVSTKIANKEVKEEEVKAVTKTNRRKLS